MGGRVGRARPYPWGGEAASRAPHQAVTGGRSLFGKAGARRSDAYCRPSFSPPPVRVTTRPGMLVTRRATGLRAATVRSVGRSPRSRQRPRAYRSPAVGHAHRAATTPCTSSAEGIAFGATRSDSPGRGDRRDQALRGEVRGCRQMRSGAVAPGRSSLCLLTARDEPAAKGPSHVLSTTSAGMETASGGGVCRDPRLRTPGGQLRFGRARRRTGARRAGKVTLVASWTGRNEEALAGPR